MAEEVFPWLKSLPLAPEYHPTLAEFQDPISFIFKIEEEASKYGICKIVPPVSASPKKTAIANLNKSLSARNPDSSPTFTTRQQQIGFCPRKHHRPVQKPVWESGEIYTVPQFEVKAKAFEKSYLKKGSNSKKGLTPLEVETLYWKAHVDKPFSVEYANDMPGSAFDQTVGGSAGKKQGKKDIGDALTVGETEWNMRGVSRAKGSLLKFMKEEIPGVTSPMVYISMLFSWFAWHVEDHDFHSLNYMHMGAGKTWYGVPRDAAVAFEDVIRDHGYGGEINPIVTFATLGEKTTIISPEVLLKAGVPCCRLVQNAGEFVVTFPRAYHSGFSHGFNCGEAANIATPGWLRVARDAAIRRASINCAPMVSHSQLLYDLAVSFSSSVPTSIKPEPRSSRLKDKLKVEGEALVKRLFFQDMMQNNHLLHILAKGSPIVVLPENFIDRRIAFQSNGTSRLSFGLHTQEVDELKSTHSSDSDDDVNLDRKPMRKFSSFCGRNNELSLNGGKDASSSSLASQTQNTATGRYKGGECDKTHDTGIFSCVTCGILCYASVAIIRPTEATANYLMSADCRGISDLVAATDLFTNEDASLVDPKSSSGQMPKSTRDGLFDVPIKSTDEAQTVDDNPGITPATADQKVNSSLGLLALAYGDSSDSDDDRVEGDIHTNCSSDLPPNNKTALLGAASSHGDHHDQDARGDMKYINDQTFDCSVEFERNRSLKDSNCLTGKSLIAEQNCLSDVHVSEKAVRQIENTPITTVCDEESSRMHIFCLEHALEVEQRLRAVGGVHMLLLCHQDYSSLDSEAKLVAKELGIDDGWTDIGFREGIQEDKEWIQSALDSEEATHGNRDWAVKLGINLFYSASLSRSPLYSKQMPYNFVIYNAFGHNSPSSSPTKPKPSSRQKKIVVAGKWCGKVWMSNQAHPLLVARDPEEQDDVKPARQSENTQMVISKNARKRKKNVLESRRMSVKTKFPKVERSSSPAPAPPPPPVDDLPTLNGGFRRQPRTNLRNKQIRKETTPRNILDQKARQFDMDSERESETDGGPSTRLRKRIIKPPSKELGVKIETKQAIKKQSGIKKAKKPPPAMEAREEDGEFACDMEGCNMSFDSKQELLVHKRNVCPVKGCGKKFFSHKYLVQHRRVHMDDRPLQCPWKGCKMTFKWAWARTEHIRVHTGARPYVCNEDGCGQTFRFVSDFSRHKRKTGHSVKKQVQER
ncbi:lysine-specific demethylase REF6-like isoform X1 [Cynara cardunculus var. scolymus]|uniref:lysine-specific demethylase REF6-like isoform X1 n=1 Tax=Cynara cardunculus var. scolymus TaxID=59895 RepID=UPI000D626529|nr:lysine-specific demethylase REF6-like isoform X1 [Cynara cardunculus var. scolymus]